MCFSPIARNAIAPLSWLRRRKPGCHVQCLWGGTRGIMLWSLSFFWLFLRSALHSVLRLSVHYYFCNSMQNYSCGWWQRNRYCLEIKHWSIGGNSGDGAVGASPMQKEHGRKKVVWNGPKPIWWTTKTGEVISSIILPPQYETHPKEPAFSGEFTQIGILLGRVLHQGNSYWEMTGWSPRTCCTYSM